MVYYIPDGFNPRLGEFHNNRDYCYLVQHFKKDGTHDTYWIEDRKHYEEFKKNNNCPIKGNTEWVYDKI